MPTGDPALDALQRRFSDLSRWLASKSGRGTGLGPDERAEIDRFRAAAMACKADHPQNPAVVAMLAQAAVWVDDDEDVEGQFRHLAELRPEDGGVIASWAEYWLGKQQPETALARIERYPRDLTASPRLALAQARALVALERWAEAQVVLDGIAPTVTFPPALAGRLVELRRVVPDCLANWPAEQALRAAEAKADDLPRVEIVTSRGPLVVELFENEAPNTVANFISLVEKGFFDGTTFARTLPGSLVQAGDPNTRPGAVAAPGMPGGPGYVIADECTAENARKHFPGSLSMVGTGPNTGGSQFTIAILPPTHNNGVRTVFGRVVDGMPLASSLSPTDSIKSAKVLRKRSHDYVPVTQ